MSMLQTDTLVRAPPSRLMFELGRMNDLLHIELLDEPQSMHNLLVIMPHLRVRAVNVLDLSRLKRCERVSNKKPTNSEVQDEVCEEEEGHFISRFYRVVVQLEGLTSLILGKACLDQASSSDDYGKWDVDYLIEAIPNFKNLRSLCLRGLSLTASDGFDVLKACAKCPTLRELDLSSNSLHELSDVVEDEDVTCMLESLNLNCNALGEFDSDSIGADQTASALVALLTKYTSLRSLDLSSNAMGNREGLSIALASSYHKCTHLRMLDLRANNWSAEVDNSIQASWLGPLDGLLI